ncbi:MAG: DUF3782 domain-containing protein [Thaumarchaeota archaeon]|nr:DUF3782 domain-containing protein [Candidatus Calditenuaceae archaeon]
MAAEIKKEILRLLKEDLEFRYAIAGLLGLEEVLKRLDRIDENIFRLWEEIKSLREETRKLWENQNRLWEEVRSLRENQEKLWEEVRALRENQEKLWEEVKSLREGQERLWRNQTRLWETTDRKLTAIGARWGVMTESAFREAMKGVLDELGLRVSRWTAWDEKGAVYGYPSEVEVDVAITDDKVVLIEVKSAIRESDVVTFYRKALIYGEKEGKAPDRLLIVTPFPEEKALESARRLGIEVHTGT